MLDHDGFVSELAQDASAFAETLRSGDLRREVAACPGWTVADLARHLGGVHRWATGIVLTGSPGDVPDGPTDAGALAAWFAEGADRVVDVLRDADPGAPVWTMGPPRQVSFWSRRQAHETAMHLWDARRAGGETGSFDADFAADGVDEAVSVFFPRQVRLGRIPPLARGLRLVLVDGPRTEHVVAGDGTDPAAAADATLTGPASDLLLAVWGRAGTDGLEVAGDPSVVLAVLSAGIVP